MIENIGCLQVSFRYFDLNTGSIEVSRYFEIESWGRKQRAMDQDLTDRSWWEPYGGYLGSNYCNKLKGVELSNGHVHPGVEKTDKLWYFDQQICRSTYMEYEVPLSLLAFHLIPTFHDPFRQTLNILKA